MRGLMIAAGASLVSRFLWILYVFGAFLVFTGLKMLFVSNEGVHPKKIRCCAWPANVSR